VIECRPEVIERVLKVVKTRLEQCVNDPAGFSPEKTQGKSFPNNSHINGGEGGNKQYYTK